MEKIRTQFGEDIVNDLACGGYTTVESVAQADVEELSLIDIEGHLAEQLIEVARNMLGREYRMPERKALTLESYTHQWGRQYQQERTQLAQHLADMPIEHIGSTSIVGLDAKPIIDIMVGMTSPDEFDQVKRVLVSHDYEFECYRDGWGLFNTRQPTVAVNVHVTIVGSQFWEEKLIFRDYLRTHPDARDAYRDLKRDLVKRYRNIIAYSNAKSQFIRQILAKAKTAYMG